MPGADSVSIGQPGQDGRPGTRKHPKVEEAEMKTIKTAQRMGIAVRIEADPNRLLMGTSYKDLGVKHYCVGGDMPALWDFFSSDGAAHNKTLGRSKPSSLPYGAHRGGDQPNASAMGYGTASRSKI